MLMTGRVLGLALHFDLSMTWIGVCVMERWVMVQPLPCIGVTFKRRPPGPRPGDLVIYPPAA